jgi:single-strand DNA-binding protein
MNETHVTVVGNIVADPIERTTRSGGPFTTFRVASTPRYRTSDGRYTDGATSFFGVCAFNVLAANAAKSLQKGQPVIVHGRLRVNEWRDERDQARVSVEVEASHIGHDLTWGQSSFSRVSRGEALGYEPMSDPEVQSSLREADDRPANVDENGVVLDPEPGAPLGFAEGVEHAPDEADPLSTVGDPDRDPYEVVVPVG